MNQNKVMKLAQEQTSKQLAKAWADFQIRPMRQSLDPNLPPAYLIDVQGLRMDGVVFTVTAAVDKNKYHLLPQQETVVFMQTILNNCIRQLMTFTGCECTATVECEKHVKPTVQ